jgi:hypothetical protein
MLAEMQIFLFRTPSAVGIRGAAPGHPGESELLSVLRASCVSVQSSARTLKAPH